MPIKDILKKSYQAIAIRDYETAEKLVLDLINLDPDKSGSYLLLGNIYTKTGQNEKAIYNFQKSIELDRKSTRLNSSHIPLSRMPSSA